MKKKKCNLENYYRSKGYETPDKLNQTRRNFPQKKPCLKQNISRNLSQEQKNKIGEVINQLAVKTQESQNLKQKFEDCQEQYQQKVQSLIEEKNLLLKQNDKLLKKYKKNQQLFQKLAEKQQQQKVQLRDTTSIQIFSMNNNQIENQQSVKRSQNQRKFQKSVERKFLQKRKQSEDQQFQFQNDNLNKTSQINNYNQNSVERKFLQKRQSFDQKQDIKILKNEKEQIDVQKQLNDQINQIEKIKKQIQLLTKTIVEQTKNQSKKLEKQTNKSKDKNQQEQIQIQKFQKSETQKYSIPKQKQIQNSQPEPKISDTKIQQQFQKLKSIKSKIKQEKITSQKKISQNDQETFTKVEMTKNQIQNIKSIQHENQHKKLIEENPRTFDLNLIDLLNDTFNNQNNIDVKQNCDETMFDIIDEFENSILKNNQLIMFIFKITIFFTVLFQIKPQEICGLIDILPDLYILDKTEFLKSSQNFQQPVLLNEMTIFGWVQFSQLQKLNPILKIQVKDNQNQFIDILYISYQQQDQESFIQLDYLNQPEIKEKKIPFEIKINQWIQLAFSLNRVNNQIQFLIKNVETQIAQKLQDEILFQELKIFEVNFDIGCFQTALDEEFKQNLDQCSFGFVDKFFYLFEYVENLENLNFITQSQIFVDNFVFNQSYQNQIPSKNTQNTIKIQNDELIQKQLLSVNNELVYQLDLKDNIIQSPTFVYQILFSEQNFENMILSKIIFMEANEQKFINFSLTKDNDNLNIKFLNQQTQFWETSLKVNLDQFNFIYISIVQYIDSFGFLIKLNDQNLLKSQLFKNQSFKFMELQIFSEENNNLTLDLLRFTFLENISGIIVSQERNGNSLCAQKCQIYAQDYYQSRQCLNCSNEKVFLSQRNMCLDFCLKGSYQFQKICTKCQNKQCEEIKQEKIQVTKDKNQNSFIVDISGFKELSFLNENPIQILANKIQIPENQLEIKPINQSVAQFTIPQDKSGQIEFDLKNDILIFDENQNQIQNQATSFQITPEQPQENNQNENIFIQPNQEVVVNNQNNQDLSNTELTQKKYIIEKRDKTVEENVYNLGKAVFIIFIISFACGLIREFFQDKNYDQQSFFYQKWIQVFLICQYIVFFLCYNFSLPYNFRKFLEGFFSVFIGTHDIFRKSIINNYNNEENFSQIYYNEGYQNFRNQNIAIALLINFGLIMIIQISVLFIFSLFFCIYKSCVRNSDQPGNKKIKLMNYLRDQFKYKLLVTIFILFTVEMGIFMFYNFTVNLSDQVKFHLYALSLFLSIIYFVLTIIILFFLFMNSERQSSADRNNNFDFILRGIQKKDLSQQFLFLEYLYFILFSFFMVAFYKSKKLQAISTFLLCLFMFLYILLVRPPISYFYKFDQIFFFFILLAIHLIFILLAFDQDNKEYKTTTRWNIGYLLLFLTVFLLFYCFLVLIIDSFREIFRYCKYKKIDQEIENVNQINNQARIPEESISFLNDQQFQQRNNQLRINQQNLEPGSISQQGFQNEQIRDDKVENEIPDQKINFEEGIKVKKQKQLKETLNELKKRMLETEKKIEMKKRLKDQIKNKQTEDNNSKKQHEFKNIKKLQQENLVDSEEISQIIEEKKQEWQDDDENETLLQINHDLLELADSILNSSKQ